MLDNAGNTPAKRTDRTCPEVNMSHFKLYLSLLLIIGIITPSTGNLNIIKKHLYMGYSTTCIMNLNYCVFGMILDLFYNTSDLHSLVYKTSLLLVIVDVMSKYLYIYFHWDRFQSLMDRLEEFSWEGTFSGGSTHENNFKAWLPRIDRFLIGYCVATVTALLIATVFSLVNDKYIQIYSIWYPFNWITWYYLVVFSQFHMGFVLVLTLSIYNSLYMKFIGMVCCQLEMLKISLQGVQQRVFGAAVKATSSKEGLQKLPGASEETIFQSIMQQDLYKDIQHHQQILKFLADLEDLMYPITFVQFLMTTIALCLAVFLTITMPEIDIRVVEAAQMWLHLGSQIFLCCWFGTQLTVQSVSYFAPRVALFQAESVRDACYGSNWYNSSKGFKICVLVMMVRCDHKFVLTAGKFATVSLATMVTIFQDAFSYMMVMLSMTQAMREHPVLENVTTQGF